MKDWERKRKKRPVYGQAHGEWGKTEDAYIDALDRKWAVEAEYKDSPRLVSLDPETVSFALRSKSTDWIYPRNYYITRGRMRPWPLGALSKCTPQQKRVWILRKRMGMKQAEIADIMGISQQRVSKLEEAASLVIKKAGLADNKKQRANLSELNKLIRKKL